MRLSRARVTGEREEGLLRRFTGRRRRLGLPPKPSYLDAPPEISPFPRFSLIELVFELAVGFSSRTRDDTVTFTTARRDRPSLLSLSPRDFL